MEASEILRTIIENEGITYSALSKKSIPRLFL